MRGKSHQSLGQYLTRHFPENTPHSHVRAFLLGCIEPDRNPVTYLKGSVRCQWLRGHNYENARRYMKRISDRLENKKKWNLFDWYTLGKLIHYTADAFTYAHNNTCPAELAVHRDYEAKLQNYFLEYLKGDPGVDQITARSIMETISACHDDYISLPVDIRTDARFALSVCCAVLAILFTPRIL